MTDLLKSRDVFIQAVADNLHGVPNANHPVQYEIKNMGDTITKCTLCFALVVQSDHDNHRRWHDAHNRLHDQIMEQAQRYVSPPSYGGH